MWQHRQGSWLICGRLWVQFPAEAAQICTVQLMLRRYCTVKGGGNQKSIWSTISDAILHISLWLFCHSKKQILLSVWDYQLSKCFPVSALCNIFNFLSNCSCMRHHNWPYWLVTIFVLAMDFHVPHNILCFLFMLHVTISSYISSSKTTTLMVYLLAPKILFYLISYSIFAPCIFCI